MNRQKELERAGQAQKILDNEIWKEAVYTTERDVIAAWTDARDTQARESHWHRLQALRDLVSHIEGVLKTGEMVSRTMEAESARDSGKAQH